MLQPETLRPETLNLYGKLSTNEAGGTFCMEPLPINIEARTNSSLRTAVLVEASVKLQGGLVRSWWSDQTLLDGLGFRVYWLTAFDNSTSVKSKSSPGVRSGWVSDVSEHRLLP